MKKRSTAGFSLIELTLALGIAAFCLIAVFGFLIPHCGADKSQCDFSYCCYQCHRLRDRGYAVDNILDIPWIWHHLRSCENIVLRWRRTVYDIVR